MSILIGIIIAICLSTWVGSLFEDKNGRDALICGLVFGSIFIGILIHMFLSTH